MKLDSELEMPFHLETISDWQVLVETGIGKWVGTCSGEGQVVKLGNALKKG